MNTQREITLPDGNVLIIKFEKEGIVYDIWNKDKTKLIEEKGYDLYHEDIPVCLIK